MKLKVEQGHALLIPRVLHEIIVVRHYDRVGETTIFSRVERVIMKWKREEGKRVGRGVLEELETADSESCVRLHYRSSPPNSLTGQPSITT